MTNAFAQLFTKSYDTQPDQEASACVIWLHGLGASCDDFYALVPELKLPASQNVRFIFPQAPDLPVTVNGGYLMPAWYDLLSLDVERKFNAEHLQQAAVAIQALISEQIDAGIASNKILLAGFSQGGAVAYEAALSFDQPLAGLLALSTYFATEASCDLNDANKQLPIAIHHGSFDEVVLPVLADKAQQALTAKGFSPEMKSYPMAHEVCFEQLSDLRAFIVQRLF